MAGPAAGGSAAARGRSAAAAAAAGLLPSPRWGAGGVVDLADRLTHADGRAEHMARAREHARARCRHLDRDLVGLDLDHRLVGLRHIESSLGLEPPRDQAPR
ncbi:MAG: hypothetical protein U0168_22430 [Nannocystaceae bacterium]